LEPLQQLYEHIKNISPIEDEIWEAMSDYWHEFTLGRKQVITRIDEVEKYLYFVVDGVQRAFIERDGKEATLVFSYTGSFSGIVDSFLLRQPSKYCLETITKSRLLRIHHRDFTKLMEQYRGLETWTRVALSHTLAGTLERNIELLSYSAEERFVTLLRRSPQVLNLIPHKYLASYIGVDPTTFSKLLGKVKV